MIARYPIFRMTGSRRDLRRRAVTLLEIVLAMGILVVVSSMTYWFYSSSLETSRHGTEVAQRLRLVRAVLDRIAIEIRQATAVTIDGRVGLRGQGERIWISSWRVPTREQSQERPSTEPPPSGEYDVTKVEYKIARHPDIQHEDGYPLALGLARTEVLVPRPDPSAADKARSERAGEEEGAVDDGSGGEGEELGAAEETTEGSLFGDLLGGEGPADGEADLGPDINWEELYAPELRYLRLCYYDGHSWWDSWDIAGDSPLPQLVQLTIGFLGHPPLGEDLGQDRINEEFCTCLNRDPVDCEPLSADQFSIVVRVPQADPLFRSRVSRETKGMVEQLGSSEEEQQP